MIESLEPRVLLAARTGLEMASMRNARPPAPPANSIPPIVDGLSHRVTKLATGRDTYPQVAVIGNRLFIHNGSSRFDSKQDRLLESYDASTGQWSIMSPPNGGEVIQALAAVGDKLMCSAIDHLDIYDTQARTWSSVPSPLLQFIPLSDGAVVGSKVLFAPSVSALGNSDTVLVYDVATGAWTSGTLSEGRAPQWAVVGSKVIFAGGTFFRESRFVSSDAVDIYDASNGQWSTSRLLQPRSSAGVAVIGTKAIFAGGSEDATFSAEIYDVSTGRSTTTTFVKPMYAPATAVLDGKAIFIGEYGGEVYDAATDTWSAVELSKKHFPAATVLGDLAIIGGGAYPPSKAVGTYNGLTGQWSTTTKLAQARGAIAATVGNQALFIGGDNGKQHRPSRVVDVYAAAPAHQAKSQP